jgi:probable rRNA maturation factor
VRDRAVYVAPWRIDLTVREGSSPVAPVAVLCRAMARALDAAGAPEPASIGLILSDDAELAELNRVHMDAEGPTDVLSFPLLPPDAFPPHLGRAQGDSGSAAASAGAPAAAGAPAPFVEPPGRRHLGDVVLSVERAVEQAGAGHGGQTGDIRWSPRDELRLLVTHGTLHVCGWDHADPEEEAAMRALEQRLLAEGR